MAPPADDDRPAPWALPGQPPPADGPPPGYGPPPGHGPAPVDGSSSGHGMAWGGRPVFPKAGGPRTGPLPLHPMTVSDILDGAFRLMKANAAAVFPIVAVFVVPLQLLAAFAQRNLFDGASIFEALSDRSVVSDGGLGADGDALLSLATGLANIFVLPFMAGAISQVVAASYLGEELGAGEALRATWRRAGSLFGAWVVVHVLEGIVFIAAVIAVVALAVAGGPVLAVVAVVALALFVGFPVLLAVMALSVAVAPAIVVERLGPIAGVRRSWSLTRRRFFAVLGIALLAGFVASVLGQILGFIPSLAGLVVGLSGGWILVALGSILTALVTQPIVAIVATLQYFDLRIRFEGFDLEVIAAELAATGPTR